MKKWKAMLFCGCACFMLCGCGEDATSVDYDAAGYVEGVLKNVYYGDSEDYRVFVNISEEDAKQEYEGGLSVETDYLLQTFGIDKINDETHQQYEDFYRDVYQKAKFKVRLKEKLEDGYEVEVVISPIDIFVKTNDDVDAAFDTELSKEFATEAEVDENIAGAVLQVLNAAKGDIDYLEDQTVIVTIKKDEEGYWNFNDEDFNAVDTYIIAY